MGWETNGKPIADNEAFGEEFVAYVNAMWINGEVVGSVFGTEQEALDDARNDIAELEGLTAEDNGTLDALNASQLEERLAEQDVIGFVMVADRQVLFS